jgi:CheY-like chemotaxis protein
MSYKCRRIVIVEEQPALQSRIARVCNELGYRDLTPIRSFRELLALTHYAHDPFEQYDLMIINGELIAMTGVDPVRFFQSNPQIRHGVIHDARRGLPQAEAIFATGRRQLFMLRTLDRQSLGTVLAYLDV